MSDTIKNVRLKDRTGNILHPEITVDAELNSTSENPIQNKVVKEAIDKNGYIIFDSQEEMNMFLDSPIAKPSIFGNLNGVLKKISLVHVDEETKIVDIINEKPTVTGLNGSEQAASWYIKIPQHTSSMKLSVKTNGYNSSTASIICIAKKEKNSYTLLKRINGDLIFSNNWTDLTVSIDSQYTKGDCIATSISNYCAYVNAENSTVTIEAHDGLVWVDDNSSSSPITVDSELSDTSENPVQNKVVKAALDAAYNPTNKEDLNKIGHDEKGNLTYNEVVVGGSSITVDAELNSTSENPVQNKVINAKLDEVFQSVSNGKTRIETAITDMGGTVSKSGSVAKIGELISGLATVASAQANIFVQEAEPETKNGLWLKTSNTYDDIVNISGTEDSVTYNKLTDIPYEFYYGSAVAIGNNIYLLGGSNSIRNNYKYDTTTNTYTKLTDISSGFKEGSAVAIGNNIYLLGGYDKSEGNYKYDTTTNTYTQMSNIPYRFYHGSAVAIGNNIYLLGAQTNKLNNYKYDTTTNTYTQMSNIPYEFYHGSAVAIGNNIYLLGAQTNKLNNYKYNITTNTYTQMSNIPYNFNDGSAVAIGNNIYLLGSSSNPSNYNYKYDTTTNTYTKLTDIPYNFYSGDAVIIDNKVYLLGGQASPKFNYRIDINILDKNSIVFLNSNMPFKHKTKMFNTPYGVLNYINFDSVIMTDENGNNANVEVYIGNGTEWTKISA